MIIGSKEYYYVLFYTNTDLKSKNLVLKIDYDESQVFSSLEDYDEYSASRFSPHPEEERLSFDRSTSSNGNSYYSDGLKDHFEDVEDSLIYSFEKNWDFILEENKGCTDLKSLDIAFYKEQCSEMIDYFKEALERSDALLLDIHSYKNFAAWVNENKESHDELKAVFADQLVGYRFNKFVANDWENKVEGEFDVYEGLKIFNGFLKTSLDTIANSEDKNSVLTSLDDLAEVMTFAYHNCGAEFEFLFEDAVSRKEKILSEMMKSLYFRNPNITLVSLYEHSGMCLQHGGGSCRWDSTSGAALIIGGDDAYKSVFSEVDNLLQGNIWYAELLQVIPECDYNLYTEDLDEIEIDTDVIKELGVDGEYKVIDLDVGVGGFVCDYGEFEQIAKSGYFDVDNAVEKNKFSIEYDRIEIVTVTGIASEDNHNEIIKSDFYDYWMRDLNQYLFKCKVEDLDDLKSLIVKWFG